MFFPGIIYRKSGDKLPRLSVLQKRIMNCFLKETAMNSLQQ